MTKSNTLFTNFHLPRWEELPTIELYSDQLISYLHEVLAPLYFRKEETIITTAMVNNYVKCNLIPPTVKKRYNRRHIAYLIVICVFKQLYGIPKIVQMIRVQREYFSPEDAYDYFCRELENALKNCSVGKIQISKDTSKTGKEERLFVRASVNAFALKLLVENYLDSKN